MNAKNMQYQLARAEIQSKIEKRLATLHKRIASTYDSNDAYEYTLRASELQRALWLFQDFSEVNNER